MRSWYEPTAEHLERLSVSWCCSFSGGKDSTAMVTWLEWLRRSGWITCLAPRLVRSDTGVEEPHLVGIAQELTSLLESCGWQCALVQPPIHKRLYNRILVGVTPIHPGIKRMRWCTRSTKIDPMDIWRQTNGDGLTLTGLRLGESAMRDGKILRATGCSAGGECGIPEPGEDKYSPILEWKTCQVVDWLQGCVGKSVRETMADVFAITRKLVTLYQPTVTTTLWDEKDVEVSARFGCIGCPAIGVGPAPPRSVVCRNGAGSPLNELYDVWFEARLPSNRCANRKEGKKPGPIRMEARKRLFARVMDIQSRAGVVLVTPEDEAFIRQCWADRVYPRGWSEADERTPFPAGPLFAEQESEQ